MMCFFRIITAFVYLTFISMYDIFIFEMRIKIMRNDYKDFSYVYDSLIDDVDYKNLLDRMLKICKKYSHKPKLVLDAACGTGNFTKELVNKGFDVIGVDSSAEMLAVAQNKLCGKCAFICQDLCELDLYGTINTVFCTLDSLNHITDFALLKKAVARMSLFLEPGGLMFFDVNTIYKHKNVLANNIFVEEKENIYMVWQNTLDNNTVNINMDFFVEEDGLYERLSENFYERAYSDEELEEVLDYAGLEILETEDFYSGRAVSENSEKVIYTVRKKEK